MRDIIPADSLTDAQLEDLAFQRALADVFGPLLPAVARGASRPPDEEDDERGQEGPRCARGGPGGGRLMDFTSGRATGHPGANGDAS
jgi:hypothetical protein